MKRVTLILSFLLFTVALSWGSLSAQEGVLMKLQLSPDTNYCHMKFPAIREDTLNTGQPVLQDPTSGEVIDFYGPCDENPVGQDQVEAQSLDLGRRLMNDYSSE